MRGEVLLLSRCKHARRVQISHIDSESFFEGLLLEERLDIVKGDVSACIATVPFTDCKETLVYWGQCERSDLPNLFRLPNKFHSTSMAVSSTAS